jgi:hypothetical protein
MMNAFGKDRIEMGDGVIILSHSQTYHSPFSIPVSKIRGSSIPFQKVTGRLTDDTNPLQLGHLKVND